MPAVESIPAIIESLGDDPYPLRTSSFRAARLRAAYDGVDDQGGGAETGSRSRYMDSVGKTGIAWKRHRARVEAFINALSVEWPCDKQRSPE